MAENTKIEDLKIALKKIEEFNETLCEIGKLINKNVILATENNLSGFLQEHEKDIKLSRGDCSRLKNQYLALESLFYQFRGSLGTTVFKLNNLKNLLS